MIVQTSIMSLARKPHPTIGCTPPGDPMSGPGSESDSPESVNSSASPPVARPPWWGQSVIDVPCESQQPEGEDRRSRSRSRPLATERRQSGRTRVGHWRQSQRQRWIRARLFVGGPHPEFSPAKIDR